MRRQRSAGASDFVGEVKAAVELAKQGANGDPGAISRGVLASINMSRLLKSLANQWVALVRRRAFTDNMSSSVNTVALRTCHHQMVPRALRILPRNVQNVTSWHYLLAS